MAVGILEVLKNGDHLEIVEMLMKFRLCRGGVSVEGVVL